MNRIVRTAPLAALLLASTAMAGPGAVYIDHATVSLALSVENVSGSPDVHDRVFELTTADPLVHVDGDFGCPVGTTADSIELMFGVMWMANNQPTGLVIWDASEPVDLQGLAWGDFDLDHALDLPKTWDPSLAQVYLGFHPAKIVNDHYLIAQANNADMVHWMQSDQVFQSSFSMNAVLWCEGPGGIVGGLDTVQVDVDILYSGDRSIDYQPVAGGPTDVTSGGSGTPGYDAGTSGGTAPTAPKPAKRGR